MTQTLQNTESADRQFKTVQEIVAARYANLRSLYGPQLFRTSVGELRNDRKKSLFATYIEGFNSAEERQHHRCTACANFVRLYGDLAFVTDDGALVSAFWGDGGNDLTIPELYAPGIRAMGKRVTASKIISPFFAEAGTWGIAEDHGDDGTTWNHFCVEYADGWSHKLLTPEQGMAAKTQDYLTVLRAITNNTLDTVNKACTFIGQSDAAKALHPQIEWLLAQAQTHAGKGARAAITNKLWKAVAAAPDAFCHPTSGAVSVVLEKISAGMSFAQLERFMKSEVMDPLNYQRPQVAPTQGNIKQAEAIVEKLGIASALKRRFATAADILPGAYIWETPDEDVKPGAGGVFGHLKPKGEEDARAQALPAKTMTWRKFKETILPQAKSVKIRPNVKDNFTAYVTAVDADAAPILKWDDEHTRNPVSWYLYPGGSTAFQWGIQGARWYDVPFILKAPPLWTGKLNPINEHELIVIAEAADSRNDSAALFPQILRNELHSVRATIEAYSGSSKLETAQDGRMLAGILLDSNNAAVRLRVDLGNGVTGEYEIDRWD